MSNRQPTHEECRRIFERMVTIRAADDAIRNELRRGRMTFFHFPVAGHEAIGATMAEVVNPEDYYSVTYRGMHHQLAKGMPLSKLLGEMAGKASGTAGGKGGQMHAFDADLGIMVTTGIVGGSTPPAVGMALASKQRRDGRITVCFFGDGSTNTGAYHEAANMATLWALPIVFVCENNRYAETTQTDHTYKGTLGGRAEAYGFHTVKVDGYDPVALFEVFSEAVERARSGGGPTFVEAMCFRYYGHYFGDPMTNVPKEELEAEKARDPLKSFQDHLVKSMGLDGAELDALIEQAQATAAQVVADTKAAAFPDPSTIPSHVYATPIEVR